MWKNICEERMKKFDQMNNGRMVGFDNYEHIWVDYLGRNIDDLYFFDDTLLNEGLIKSWSELDFIRFLKKSLSDFDGLKYDIEIDEETIIIRIYNFNNC